MHWRLTEALERLRATLGGKRDTEMDEELRFHIDKATSRNMARGMSAEDARRAALLAFGGVQRTREDAWDGQRLRWIEDAWQDARHSVRMLRRTPAFTAAAVLTLALGIGANSAILGVLDAVLLRPLPYDAPSELVAFEPGRYDAFREWTTDAATLQATGAYTYSIANVAGGSEPVRVWTLAVTSSLLPTLGVRPFIGRGFAAEDDVPQAPPRLMLRHGFWRTHFGGDRGLVGRTVELDGLPHEVIGVLPAELEFPPPVRRGDGSMPRTADVWIGAGRLSDLHERGGFYAIGRLAPGATAERASAELTARANADATGTGATASSNSGTPTSAGSTNPGAGNPARPTPQREPLRVTATPVSEAVVAPLRPAVLAFTAGVGLILLIACANLGGLLLARLAGRQRELAVRISLGAARGRIVRQILTEGAVLAFAGAVIGLAIAWLLLRTLVGLAPPELARVQDASLNARVLVTTLALAAFTAILIGVLPALRAVRRDPRESIGSTRGATTDRGTGRAHGMLVAAEVAFAVVLLVGGGLLLRSFAALASVDPGFRAEGLVTADVLIPGDRYPERASVLAFFDRLEERVAARPGVASASAIDRLPYGASFSRIPFQIPGRADAGASPPTGYNTATRPGYFQTMGIPIDEGREFTDADASSTAPVVVIGRALAERHWPGASAMGERIIVWGVEREIVGVAGDIRHLGPTTPPDPMLYLPQSQDVVTRRMMTVVVRTRGSPESMLAALRGEIRALDPQLPVSNLRTFGALRADRTAAERFNALLIASFATLAVVLSAVGIYGVMSFVVAQRTREIGVRMALGATRGSVMGMFLRHALRAVAIGGVIGIAIALPAARLVRGMLYGIAPTDPFTYLGVVLLIGAIALLAAWAPAGRAARVSPSAAMVAD